MMVLKYVYSEGAEAYAGRYRYSHSGQLTMAGTSTGIHAEGIRYRYRYIQWQVFLLFDGLEVVAQQLWVYMQKVQDTGTGISNGRCSFFLMV